MWNELFITYNGPSLFCELLANYTRGVDRQIIRILKIKESTLSVIGLTNLPFLITTKGDKITSEIEIGRFITTLTGVRDILFGRSDIEIISHENFIKDFDSAENKLEFLNTVLRFNTYCNGFNITISDLYAFGHVILQLQLLNDIDKSKFSNMFRWALHVQSLKGINEQIQRLKMHISLPCEKLFIDLNYKEESKEAKGKEVDKKKDKKEKTPKKESKHVDKPKGEEKTKETKVKSESKHNDKPKGEEKVKVEKVKIVAAAGKSTETKPKEVKTDVKPKESKPKEPKEVKADTKPKEDKKQKAPAKKDEDDRHPISRVDIRVGKIISVQENKDSEKLYNEEIDIGNGEIRKIASGLKNKIPIEKLQGSLVVVLCNLKEKNLCGWPSHGMLLCCSKGDQYDFLKPPEGSQPGDLVKIGSYDRLPDDVLNTKKNNPWDLIKDKIFVNSKGVAVYDKDDEWITKIGTITNHTLVDSHIS